MIKELIGGVTTFFVMLPFLLLNRYVFKIKNQKKFAFSFILANAAQGAFLFLLAYGLFSVGQDTLFGMLIVFTVFLFFNLFLLISSKRRIARDANEDSEYDDEDDDEDDNLYDEELFESEKLARTQKLKGNIAKEMEDLSNDDILEENQFTMKVEDPDFSKIEKSEVMKTLEDIFKEK